MLDQQRLRKDGPDPGGFPLEQFRPSGIVVHKQNPAVQWLDFSNMGGANLLVGERHVAVSQQRPPTPDYSCLVAKDVSTGPPRIESCGH
jgi:hypothetical protein